MRLLWHHHHASLMALDMASLDNRIADLAQELQDKILDHTLIATAQESLLPDVLITNNYRPPWQTRFDSRSRKEFIKWYYKHNIFRKQNSVQKARPLIGDSPSSRPLGR